MRMHSVKRHSSEPRPYYSNSRGWTLINHSKEHVSTAIQFTVDMFCTTSMDQCGWTWLKAHGWQKDHKNQVDELLYGWYLSKHNWMSVDTLGIWMPLIKCGSSEFFWTSHISLYLTISWVCWHWTYSDNHCSFFTSESHRSQSISANLAR